MTVRVGVVGVMRMVVCVGIPEWTRPSRQHNVTVGPTVRMTMDMSSMPMEDSARTGHACLTLARHDELTVWRDAGSRPSQQSQLPPFHGSRETLTGSSKRINGR